MTNKRRTMRVRIQWLFDLLSQICSNKFPNAFEFNMKSKQTNNRATKTGIGKHFHYWMIVQRKLLEKQYIYAQIELKFENIHLKGNCLFERESDRFDRTNDNKPFTMYKRTHLHTAFHVPERPVKIYPLTTNGSNNKRKQQHAFHCVIVFTEPYDGDKDKPQVQSKR